MLITFEGIDGAGKTTQIKHLMQNLGNAGITSIYIREPGGCKLSEDIRNLLLHTKNEMEAITEVLLFSASRAELVSKVIKPTLKNVEVVILDRFYDSMIAYQGFGRGVDLGDIHDAINLSLDDDIKVDLTFLIDIPVQDSYKRRKQNCSDRIENAGDTFFTAVRNGYLQLAEEFPSRIKVIDGMQDESIIADNILRYLEIGIKKLDDGLLSSNS